MPYAETGPRESTWGDSPTMTFCITIWDEGDFPELSDCNDFLNNDPWNEGGRDDLRAKAYAESILPPVRYIDNGLCEDVLYLQSFTLKELVCGQKYKVNATYGANSPNNLASCKLSFQTGGATQNITQAKAHVSSHFCPPAPPARCTVRHRLETIIVSSNPDGTFNYGCVNRVTGNVTPGPCRYPDGSAVPVGQSTFLDYCRPAGGPIDGSQDVLGPCRDSTGAPAGPGQCIDSDGKLIFPVGNCPDMFGGAINVTESGVAGTDILSQGLSFALTACFGASEVDCDYVFDLYEMAPSFNEDPFFGCFEPGEVLFKGASGQGDGNSFCVTFDFCGSPNMVNGQFGCITGINKLGWDYLWFYYEDRPNFNCHKLVKYPHSAHVERVYCPKDFSRLRLPC